MIGNYLDESMIGRIRDSYSPDDLIKSIDFEDFINQPRGEELVERIEGKGINFRGRNSVDYERIDIYPGNKRGEFIFVFIFENIAGYEGEEPVRIDERVLLNLDLFDFVQSY